MYTDESTVFVIVSDTNYYDRAKRTIKDLRSTGQWHGDIVLIAIEENLYGNDNFKKFHKVQTVWFPNISKDHLVTQIKESRFESLDGRELTKTNQWEKLHVFDRWFNRWARVVYLDAGLRVLAPVDELLAVPWRGKFLCPDEAGPSDNPESIFRRQLSHHDPSLIEKACNEWGNLRKVDVLASKYFLNCMWVYDTDLLDIIKKDELIATMNDYPIFRCNEMGAMNAIINIKYGVWTPLPYKTRNGKKWLFEWSDANHPGTTWEDYCMLKYPISIGFDCC